VLPRNALLLLLLPADVVTAQADDRHLFSGAAQRAITHPAADRLHGSINTLHGNAFTFLAVENP
jgi:hypothetical protein